MEQNRKQWNQRQKALRQSLQGSQDHAEAIELFLVQHAMVHSTEMSPSEVHSFEEEVWRGIDEQAIRRVHRSSGHSIAWHIWHIARIEDATMNLLVAGGSQLLDENRWFERLKVSACDTGNAMGRQEIANLSTAIDIEVLRAYRQTVGRRTREIVTGLRPEELHRRVEPSRLQRVMDEGAVVEQARGLVDYWGRRTIAGLLLMPPTRHNFVHLNQALRIK